jgi:hypothetical protein
MALVVCFSGVLGNIYRVTLFADADRIRHVEPFVSFDCQVQVRTR